MKVFVEPNVVSNTPNICWPEPSGLPVLVPGGAALRVSSLGSDLVHRLLLVACGAAVAMLVFVAMGPTLAQGVEC